MKYRAEDIFKLPFPEYQCNAAGIWERTWKLRTHRSVQLDKLNSIMECAARRLSSQIETIDRRMLWLVIYAPVDLPIYSINITLETARIIKELDVAFGVDTVEGLELSKWIDHSAIFWTAFHHNSSGSSVSI